MKTTQNQQGTKVSQQNSQQSERLLSVKELADALGRSVRYVFYMKAKGFEMPGGRTTLSEALRFLEKNDHPSGRF